MARALRGADNSRLSVCHAGVQSMLEMNRREWMAAAAALTAGSLPFAARAQGRVFEPLPGAWRSFEVTTSVEVLDAKGPTQLWLPLPSVDGEFQQSRGH